MKGRLATILGISLPALLAVGVALAWAAWSTSGDHQSLSRTAAQADREKALTEALSYLSREVGGLAVLRRVSPEEVSGTLAPHVQSGYVLSGSMGRRQMLASLEAADRGGPRVLDRLRRTGFVPSQSLERAMSPTPGGVRDLVVSDRGTRGLPIADYETAVAELSQAFADSHDASAAALKELTNLADEPAPWRRPAFLALAAGLLAFVLAACAAIAWRVARRLTRAEVARDEEREHAERLARRNARLLAMVDVTRRVQSGNDLRSVSMAIAEETRDLLGASCSVVYLLDDEDTAHPVASAGEPPPAAIRCPQGVVGRSIDTGSPTRAVVAGDPAFPESPGALSLIATPLVAGRKVTGAIVAAMPDGPLPDDEDELTLRLIALAAATTIEAARAHDTTAKLVHTDPLTGLANRRRLDGDLAGLSEEEHEHGVAFLMIDVDHFKAYNDAHGHPAGDVLLRQIADTISECVRDTDVVYRLGGEEFAVLLRGAAEPEAEAIASRIRSAVAGQEFTGAGTQPGGRVTVSVGVSRHLDGSDTAALVSKADEALYTAKRTGRDRVVFAG
jgi:diguanylate cyclase (GGDEF)-like protein